ncbi:DNA methyltransferase [Desulfitibacter alkalitolerans]|uniref:DNA methyltransferase n=1 Tax=Desulfitibacter alkalitolerans TaxID=264641 RepID=UPI0004814A58|nr:DNA methyltransferase [Desulfitibacter alkalitolerans]
MKLTKEILDSVRHIEGFPIGKDEDIIELSDPPHYTACPNPFINDFIEKHGTPYNEEEDYYEVEPYSADVSEGKQNPIYNAHSYHTKIPHKAIMRFILHYTNPEDIVFDGFCGTGMTGVGAQMCSNPDKDFKMQIENEMPKVKWGPRKSILNDLSPAATFISYNYNSPVQIKEYKKLLSEIIVDIEKKFGWMYETHHTLGEETQYDNKGNIIKGKISYIVWSDVFICSSCSEEVVFWDVAVNKESGKVLESFKCSNCSATLTKKTVEKGIENAHDYSLKRNIKAVKTVPVMISYNVGKMKYYKRPDANDFDVLRKIDSINIPFWYPIDSMMLIGERWGDSWRAGYHFGMTNVHHFFRKRTLIILANFYNEAKKLSIGNKLLYVLTGSLQGLSKQQRYRLFSSFPNMILSGTLYIGSLQREWNATDWMLGKIRGIVNSKTNHMSDDNYIVTSQSTSNMSNMKSNSIDYIFTDPPFGDNLMYSELNFIWESWLKVFTNNKSEAIINKTQGKNLYEYQALMERCFSEYYRVLKPGRWMTIVFHNSSSGVWNAIQEAILKAGFVIANVRILDKQQGSFKQVTTTSAVKQDLVISAYKPKESFVEKFLMEAGTEEGAWAFVREHLKKLPVVIENNGVLDIISERQNYLLYDAMLAFHIQKGASIPMGAADFYKGLKQRFSERDGMYFLPEQVNRYDEKRIRMDIAGQLSLYVFDEKTTIQWLYKELETPQTYQDIQPKFLRELHQIKHEKLPELKDILTENFLQNEKGQWYAPDLNKRSDLEKLREKNLLKEFEEYRIGKGKLKIFRTEAVRTGFKKCWRDKDYKTIVAVGNRLPANVIQEDSSLLMYYDNASTRIGD